VFSIRRTEDVDEVRELHGLTFPLDEWIGDEYDFWIVRDRTGRGIAFAAAMHHADTGVVSLDRAGVLPEFKRCGLQKRLVKARLRWALKQGAKACITYIAQRNYPSMVNLLKCGFRFYTPERTGEYDDEDSFHFLRIDF
jgi:GNAT superfamily N-acetyltransferase